MDIKYEWVENDPMYIKGIVVAKLPSGVALATIRPVRMGWAFRREYMLTLVFKNVGRGNPIGGYFKSMEEAKANAERMLNYVFGDEKLVPKSS